MSQIIALNHHTSCYAQTLWRLIPTTMFNNINIKDSFCISHSRFFFLSRRLPSPNYSFQDTLVKYIKRFYCSKHMGKMVRLFHFLFKVLWSISNEEKIHTIKTSSRKRIRSINISGLWELFIFYKIYNFLHVMTCTQK